jgi:hypothetical protein
MTRLLQLAAVLPLLGACFEREIVVRQEPTRPPAQLCEHLSMRPRTDAAAYQTFHATPPLAAIALELHPEYYAVTYPKGAAVTEVLPNGSRNEYPSPSTRLTTFAAADFTIECLLPSATSPSSSKP